MDFDFGHAATMDDFHGTYNELEILGEGCLDGAQRRSMRTAQRRSMGDLHDLGWKEVVFNCKQDSDGCISCTSLSGENVGAFPVPSGELPFSAWVAEELITVRSQGPEQLHLVTLVDPAGVIFYTQWQFVAIKQVQRNGDRERATAVHWNLRHENVVRLLNIFCSGTTLMLVYELMDSSLQLYMKARRQNAEVHAGLSPEEVKTFMRQLMAGMEFLHARSVMHRNIKPQNILIDSHGALKIAGFNLARVANLPNHAYTHEVITTWYRPPEILLGCYGYGSPVDVWSCGCCFAEMASGQPLFPGDSEISTIFHIFQKLGTPTEAEWRGLKDLPDFKSTFPQWVKKPWSVGRWAGRPYDNLSTHLRPDGLELLEGLLRYDPIQRISARTALTSQYLTN